MSHHTRDVCFRGRSLTSNHTRGERKHKEHRIGRITVCIQNFGLTTKEAQRGAEHKTPPTYYSSSSSGCTPTDRRAGGTHPHLVRANTTLSTLSCVVSSRGEAERQQQPRLQQTRGLGTAVREMGGQRENPTEPNKSHSKTKRAVWENTLLASHEKSQRYSCK